MAAYALIIVDVQPTFCEGGELPVAGGNDVAHRIAAYVAANWEQYHLIVTTQDWHIDPGTHFATPPNEPDMIDTWPPHGVAGTPHAELHPAISSVLEGIGETYHVKKGAYAAAYSGFEGLDDEGRSLTELLRACSHVDVVGLAESHCVKATALDAHALGFPTRVFTDLTAPVSAELGALARAELTTAGVTLERATS